MTLSNARLQTFGGYIPIYDYVCYNAELKIWRGKPLPQPGQREEQMPTLFFSRKYQPDINDMDVVFCEYEFKDKSLVGERFLLVPKEKLLFGYTDSSTIVLPPPRLSKRPGL